MDWFNYCERYVKKLSFSGVAFEWVRSSRRKKSVALKPGQAVQLQLVTPGNWSERQLMQFLQQNQQWFLRSVKRVPVGPVVAPLERGREIELLGQTHRLEVVFTTKSGFQLWKEWGVWCVFVSKRKVAHALRKEGDSELQALIQRELQSALSIYFFQWLQSKLEFWQQQMGVRASSVVVKNYRSRWGSCDARGGVQFNWRLVFAPEWVVEYVVVHELAHLFERNHGEQFWQIVAEHFPRYQEAKSMLRQNGQIWMGY